MPRTGQDGIPDLLRESATRVLETMFFMAVEEENAAGESSSPLSWAEVRFQGEPPGVFYLGLTEDALAEAASGFLGVEPDSPDLREQAGNVLREMANVICGAALSGMVSGRSFHLGSPRLLEKEPAGLALDAAGCTLHLNTGLARVLLCLESAP